MTITILLSHHLKKNSSPLHGSMIAKITLSKILKMPLEKYVRYIERKFNGSEDSQGKRLSFYAKVITKNGDLRLEIADQRLLKRYPINETNRNAVIVKMINTRNELSEHIVGGILKFQKKFWESGKESDIKPSTFKQFLSLFPCHRLDRSRLSRLVSVLPLQTQYGKIVSMRELFITRKRFFATVIKKVIDESDEAVSDKDIQTILRKHYDIHISVRVICNCRKLLNIPNYKSRLAHYYGKDIRFSDYVKLSKGQYNRIHSEGGVYELSSANKIQYAKHRSDVLYIGSSKNIRKRLLSYSGSNGKNAYLKRFTNDSDIFVRYCLTEDYLQLEKQPAAAGISKLRMANYRKQIN